MKNLLHIFIAAFFSLNMFAQTRSTESGIINFGNEVFYYANGTKNVESENEKIIRVYKEIVEWFGAEEDEFSIGLRMSRFSFYRSFNIAVIGGPYTDMIGCLSHCGEYYLKVAEGIEEDEYLQRYLSTSQHQESFAKSYFELSEIFEHCLKGILDYFEYTNISKSTKRIELACDYYKSNAEKIMKMEEERLNAEKSENEKRFSRIEDILFLQ